MGNIWVIVGSIPHDGGRPKLQHALGKDGFDLVCSCQACREWTGQELRALDMSSALDGSQSTANDSTCRLPASDNGFWEAEEKPVP
uniref:Uncharacterized protein n=1 Tax=Knipowitschia caucasica TaxID=637954 RepID=A0AAV2K2V0_KNICA